VLAEHITYIDDFEFFDLIIVNHLTMSWLIDKGPRVQGFKGSSEKALKTNK